MTERVDLVEGGDGRSGMERIWAASIPWWGSDEEGGERVGVGVFHPKALLLHG